MIERYKLYRSYGHGVIISAIQAPTAMQIIVTSCIVGIILGVLV